jgi:Xaa-Pro aminopeptidase
MTQHVSPGADARGADAIAQIRSALRAREADAYVAFTPSNIRYTTGFGSYFVSEWWRMHGTVLAVVPADESLPVALVVSDFESRTAHAAAPDVRQHTYRLWVDLGTSADLAAPDHADPPRPEQYNEPDLVRAIAAALEDAGALSPGAQLATDLPHVTIATRDRLRAAAPDAVLVDFTDAMYRIRAIKQPAEVDALRRGVELSEAGMQHAAVRLEEGMTARDVRLLYQAGVIDAARGSARYVGFTDSWVLPTVGTTTSASYGATGTGLQRGDLVKFDCGATVDGYRSDGGRTFAFGQPRPEAAALYKVLAEAQEIACSALRPGAVVADVFKAAMHHVREHGYPSYNRGHIGHSIGIDTFHEEPPYLSGTCTDLLQPGMVFAVELPTYTPDIGAIMIEDLVLVGEDGPVRLHTMSHELVVVS